MMCLIIDSLKGGLVPDLNQVNNGTMLLYIVFAICSVYIFDKLNNFYH